MNRTLKIDLKTLKYVNILRDQNKTFSFERIYKIFNIYSAVQNNSSFFIKLQELRTTIYYFYIQSLIKMLILKGKFSLYCGFIKTKT